MKRNTLMALAVAGTFACGGAFAGPFHFGGHQSGNGGMQASSAEAITPSSVNESAPWLANQPHSAGWMGNAGTMNTTVGISDDFYGNSVGASSAESAWGSGGYDSVSMSSTPGYDASIYGLDYSLNDTGGVDYWLLGDDSLYGTGVSSSTAGYGSVGFDSMSSPSFDQSSQSFDQSSLGNDEYGVTDYYVVSDLSHLSNATMYEAGSDELAFLSSPPEGVWLVEPIYDTVSDASAFSGSSDQASMSSFDTSDYSGD